MFIGITGSTGGLGRRLTEILLERGHKVRCLVRSGSDVGFLKEYNAYKAEVFYGNILDKDSLEDFVRDIDACIHVAAQVSASSRTDLYNTNINGTLNLCEALCMYNTECRLLYCSSIVTKNLRFYQKPFVSDYTMSKFYAEKVVNKYIKKIKTTIIYPGYILGKYDRALMPYIISMLKSGLDFYIRGGERNAPVIYVDDLCELFYQTLINEKSIGKNYVSIEKQEKGMHYVVSAIADKMNYKHPQKIYPKAVVRIYLKLNPIMSRIFNRKKIDLKLRALNILSNHGKFFNNAFKDIGWQQKYTLDEIIDTAYEDYMKYVNKC